METILEKIDNLDAMILIEKRLADVFAFYNPFFRNPPKACFLLEYWEREAFSSRLSPVEMQNYPEKIRHMQRRFTIRIERRYSSELRTETRRFFVAEALLRAQRASFDISIELKTEYHSSALQNQHDMASNQFSAHL